MVVGKTTARTANGLAAKNVKTGSVAIVGERRTLKATRLNWRSMRKLSSTNARTVNPTIPAVEI